MECEFPTQNATSEEIRGIFANIKTIAVLGLSPNPAKDSHKVAKYLQEQGYKIVPVYPKESKILGEDVYRDLEEIPFKVDLVNMFRKPEVAFGVVEKMKKLGLKALWMQQGIVNNKAAEDARESGIVVVQNKCTMVEHRNL